jgi:hypothetical protein
MNAAGSFLVHPDDEVNEDADENWEWACSRMNEIAEVLREVSVYDVKWLRLADRIEQLSTYLSEGEEVEGDQVRFGGKLNGYSFNARLLRDAEGLLREVHSAQRTISYLAESASNSSSLRTMSNLYQRFTQAVILLQMCHRIWIREVSGYATRFDM